MSGELVVAVLAVVVSAVSFEWNRRAAASTLRIAEAADRHARMPVLTPYVDGRHGGVLFIRNVGNGPALNIMLADGKPILTETDLREASHALLGEAGTWYNHRHLRPIPPGAERRYQWNYQGAVGLTYTDPLGAPYTLVTSPHGTMIIDDMIIPARPFPGMPYLYELVEDQG